MAGALSTSALKEGCSGCGDCMKAKTCLPQQSIPSRAQQQCSLAIKYFHSPSFRHSRTGSRLQATARDRHRLRLCVCRAAEQVYAKHTTSDSSTTTAQPGLIFTCGAEGSWDVGGVGKPVVRCYMGDDEQRWYMWYDGYSLEAADTAAPHPACIGLATSTDGVRWLRGDGDVEGQQGPSQLNDVGRVLGPNTDWWWHDTRHVGQADVQIFSSDTVNTGVGVYWMFYTGGSFEEAAVPAGLLGLPEGQQIEGLRTRVGLAMSQDGRNWARIEANHHTGALFDTGDEGQWDHLLNGAPQVLALGPNDMRMYYHTFDISKRKWVVGRAMSKDGFNWTKKGPIFEGGQDTDFDALGAAAHQVIRDVDSQQFVMFYEAVAPDNRRTISIAVSKDGLTGWRRLGRPLLSGSSSSSAWDSADVGVPCAVSMAEGKWRLYYGGRQQSDRPWEGIGLAITDTDSSDTFEGVRIGFKRRAAQQ